MVRHAGFAPRIFATLPTRCLGLILRLGVRGDQWKRMEVLLEPNLAEHEALLEASDVAAYPEIESEVLLLGGSRSPGFVARGLQAPRSAIPDATVAILDGLDHLRPETHPELVGRRVQTFFASRA